MTCLSKGRVPVLAVPGSLKHTLFVCWWGLLTQTCSCACSHLQSTSAVYLRLLPTCLHGCCGSIYRWGRRMYCVLLMLRAFFFFFLNPWHIFFGAGNRNPLQYSCLENPMDRGPWRAIVHRVAKSWTWLKQLSTYILMITSTDLRKR